jgi:TolA-binding protein
MNSITVLDKETAEGKPKTVEDRLDKLEARVVELEINLFNMLKDMVETFENEMKKRISSLDESKNADDIEDGMCAP